MARLAGAHSMHGPSHNTCSDESNHATTPAVMKATMPCLVIACPHSSGYSETLLICGVMAYTLLADLMQQHSVEQGCALC